MSPSEEIKNLTEELEDLREERQYTLGRTGVHISAKKVIALREHYDEQISALERRIRESGGTV